MQTDAEYIAELVESLNASADFPEPVTAFSQLKRYVYALYEFLPHVSAQQALRIKSRLLVAGDPVEIGELEWQLGQILEDEETMLPRVLWGGVLVATYSAFEHGVKQMLGHWSRKASCSKTIRVRKGDDFIVAAEEYAAKYCQVSLFRSPTHRSLVQELKLLRNSYAHAGSLVSDLPQEVHASIEARDEKLRIDRSGAVWAATPHSATFYLLATADITSEFGYAIMDRCRQHI